MTQQELANQLGVTQRTVGNWERGESIPRNREPLLRRILAAQLTTGQPANYLDLATDMELLAEIARRMAKAGTRNQQRTPDVLKEEPAQNDYRLAAREAHNEIGLDQLPEGN